MIFRTLVMLLRYNTAVCMIFHTLLAPHLSVHTLLYDFSYKFDPLRDSYYLIYVFSHKVPPHFVTTSLDFTIADIRYEEV